MLIMTGKILFINKVEIVSSSNEKFNKVYLVLNKQMNKVKRNICFESYGKIGNKILTYTKGQRLKVYFTIDSSLKGDKWYHALKVVDVELVLKQPKINNEYQTNIINKNNDTFTKTFEG